MNTDVLSNEEAIAAIKKMKKGKAPGHDKINIDTII
jgi:hypothetical protein